MSFLVSASFRIVDVRRLMFEIVITVELVTKMNSI